jgi:hypothetical protein
LSDFDQRFENWVRWCNQRGLHRATCGSAEGNWKSPQVWEAQNPRPAEIDTVDAVRVNRAFTKLALSAPSHAQVIKVIVFMPWLRPTRAAQMLGTHWTRLDEKLNRAKLMMRNLMREGV